MIRKAYKKGRSQSTRDVENSSGNSRSGKVLTLSSHIYYASCTECVMSKYNITQMIGICNQSDQRDRMRHVPVNGLVWFII